MKYLFTISFALIIGLLSAQKPKGKLFIIGGGDRLDFLVDRMIKEAGLNAGEYVAVLPQASGTQDSSIMSASVQFEKRNLKVLDCSFNKNLNTRLFT